MKIFQFLSIACFLVAATANDECIGGIMLLIAFGGICAGLSVILPKHRRRGPRK